MQANKEIRTIAIKSTVRLWQIADEMGIVKKSLENYRDGKSQPTAEQLEKIAIYFKKDMNYFFDQPGWNEYNLNVKPSEIVKEEKGSYEQTSSGRNPWELLYETQRELMEVKVENERLKKGYVQEKNAKTG